jgi:hypothetical protein
MPSTFTSSSFSHRLFLITGTLPEARVILVVSQIDLIAAAHLSCHELPSSHSTQLFSPLPPIFVASALGLPPMLSFEPLVKTRGLSGFLANTDPAPGRYQMVSSIPFEQTEHYFWFSRSLSFTCDTQNYLGIPLLAQEAILLQTNKGLVCAYVLDR